MGIKAGVRYVAMSERLIAKGQSEMGGFVKEVELAELDGGEWLILGGYIICTCSLTGAVQG
jgi:hypothetical protein